MSALQVILLIGITVLGRGAGVVAGGERIAWLGSFLSDGNQGEMPVNACSRFGKQRQNSVSNRNELPKLAQSATTPVSLPRQMPGCTSPSPGPLHLRSASRGFLMKFTGCRIDCTVWQVLTNVHISAATSTIEIKTFLWPREVPVSFVVRAWPRPRLSQRWPALSLATALEM